MTAATREQVAQALFNLLTSSSGYNTTGRRFITDDQLSACQKPALFMYEHKETHVKGKNITPAVRTLDVDVYIFIASGLDPNNVPITTLNNLIDAIDPVTGGVLSPFPNSQQTLGGLVTNVYIDGKILKTPGDINGLGVAVIPIKVVYM
jgi:hypothetical protein